MLSDDIISAHSSEKSSNSNEVNFNQVYIHNDKIESVKNSKTYRKSNSGIVNSESVYFEKSEKSSEKSEKSEKSSEKSEKSFDKKSNSSTSKKKEEKKKNLKNISTERELIKRKNYENSDNSSYKSEKKIEFVHEVVSMASSYIKKSIRSVSESSSYYDRSDGNINNKCLICEEKLTEQEKEDNLIQCFHIFCNNCYYNFLKVKIDSNYIEGIKCLYAGCDTRLYENFIEKKLLIDIPLLEKYKKLNRKRQLMLNPNIQLCPFPDCESYAEKKGEKKYVSCKKGHEFCFNCLKAWHGNKECDTSVDKSFEKWRDSDKVKRCPKCKYFIEKNEGCNHITCYNCKYQFCWLCLGEYTSGHFDFGRCTGLQYTECSICSNRLINFLYQLLLVFAKCLLFGIGLPFIVTFALSYVIGEKINYNLGDGPLLICGILGCTSLFNFIMCIIPLTSSIALLMLFYWPLQDKIFGLFNQC